MKRIFIQPLDVLMFRSSRPFIAKETHIAERGIISPSIFAGALKTKILLDFCAQHELDPAELQRRKDRQLEEKIKEFKERVKAKIGEIKGLEDFLKIIGHPLVGEETKLKIIGAFFAKNGHEYFRLPNDIRFINNKPIKISPVEGLRDTLSLSEIEPVLSKKELRFEEGKEGFIEFKELVNNYLDGSTPQKIVNRDNIYKVERRPGVELEHPNKKARDEALYMAEFYRLEKDWGFIVWYDCEEEILPDESLLKLGGEGRGAYYHSLKELETTMPFIIEKINKERRFKLYLATPSIFEDGWKQDENKIKKMLGINGLTLISALPEKPIYIGSYDLALNMEKPLWRGVNAGAVYFYKFKEGKINPDLPQPLPISDKYPSNGLGASFIGRW